MNAPGLPLLSLMLIVPVCGGVLIWLAPRAWARGLALCAALAALGLAMAATATFDRAAPGFQFVEQAAWMPSVNVNIVLGVDGISLLFLPATALLFAGVMLASWNGAQTLPQLHYSLLLLLESATLGVFCALDTVLFFLFWELTLVPVYFLLSLWGAGPQRRHAATKYLLVMMAGGVPLLFGLLLPAFNYASMSAAEVPAGLSFDLRALLAMPLPKDKAYLVFLLLLLGCGVKLPLFPLHTWLPLVAMEGPAGVTAVLAGLKVGAYGLIRFAIPLAPEAAREMHWLLAGLGVAGLLFGAVAALAQTNLRRMLAYSSLSHVGLVLLGIASFSVQGLQGAVLQLLNLSLAAGGCFLVAGFLQARVGSTDVLSLGGAARSAPLLASFFLLFGLAGMGLPLTSGFPGELLILVSAVASHTGAGIAALAGGVVGAAAFLGLYRRAFFGPVQRPDMGSLPDLRPRELAVVLAFAALIVAVGVAPAALLDSIAPAADAWVARLPLAAR